MYKIPMQFSEFDKVFLYDGKTGEIRNKVDRGQWGEIKAGRIATTSSNGYLKVTLNGKQYFAHRVAWLLHAGDDPGSDDVNHRNQNRSDNRIQNLELVTAGDHKRKMPKLSNNTSGCTGVCWDIQARKWRVQISISGKSRTLGVFEDYDIAVKCRKAAERAHGYYPEHGMTKEEVRKYFKDQETEEDQNSDIK